MIDISLNKIKKNYGFGDVLKEVSFEIHKGERVALIGENGSGKSTLLKIIMKEEMPSSGVISLRKGVTIGYLHQETNLECEDILVKDLLYQCMNKVLLIQERLNYYEKMLEETTGEELERVIIKYSDLQEEYLKLSGYEVSERICKIVKGFKIEKLLDSCYRQLSGGEKRIVLMAKMMINNPDVLILDEPTNHLDLETLEWLEQYLKNYFGTILCVSHDRYFVNEIATKIIYLDQGNIDMYYGNYDYFLREYQVRYQLAQKKYQDEQKEITRLKKSAKKLREFGKLGDNEIFFKRAKSIEKRIEKMDLLVRPNEKQEIPLSLDIANRTGNDVLIIKDFSKKIGDRKIFDKISVKINYQERVALLGENGSGKSTLIKEIINGNDNIKLGSNIKIGYIPQEIDYIGNETVLEYARKNYYGEEQYLRSSLHKFLLTKDNIYKKVSSLSGGEKVRLKLFCLMQEKVNFLILDEPTNHLDITTREVLERTIRGYLGTVLFVSHDRYFINELATKIIVIKNYGISEYCGNYNDYQQCLLK